MSAGAIDLNIDQGATFSQGFQWLQSNNTPVNLTGYTGYCQIRANAQSSLVLATFAVTVTDATNGKFVLDLTAEQTASIPTDGSAYKDVMQYVYDVKFKTGTSVYRVINGYAYISPEVTRQ